MTISLSISSGSSDGAGGISVLVIPKAGWILTEWVITYTDLTKRVGRDTRVAYTDDTVGGIGEGSNWFLIPRTTPCSDTTGPTLKRTYSSHVGT